MTMHPAPRFGVQTIQTLDWPTLRDRWRWLEDLGFDSLWLPDHFFPTAGKDVPMLEAWTLLAGLAVATRRARLGVLVSSNTFRHPALLAKQAVTVDHLSGGRLELGLGAGWMEQEHDVFGIPFPDAGERVDRLAEAVALIDTYLTNDETSFAGTHYRLNGAFNRPASIQRPRPPLVMGAHGPRMLRLVARYADTWNSFAPPAELARRNAQLTACCEELGRDPATITRSVFYGVNQALDEHPWRSVDAFADYVERYSAAGMHEFIMQLPPTADPGVVERIASDILPARQTLPANDGEQKP